jgi:hypothetical protein
MNRLPVNFISNNIGFNFWRRGSGNDLDGNDLDKVHHRTAHIQSDVVRMVRLLVICVKYQSYEQIEEILNNSTLLLEMANQWFSLPSIQIRDVYTLALTEQNMDQLLLRILQLDIPSRTCIVQFFLLDLCGIFISSQSWSFSQNHVFLFNLLKVYGDIIADYIPDSIWFSLKLDMAEQLLDLGKKSITSHVKNLKGLFVEERGRLNTLLNLPWVTSVPFVFQPGLNILKDITYYGNVNFSMQIQLSKPAKSKSLRFLMTFDAKAKLIPEFAIFIETKTGQRRLAEKLFFMTDADMNDAQQKISRGMEKVTLCSFLEFKFKQHFVADQGYRLILKLMKLSSVTDGTSRLGSITKGKDHLKTFKPFLKLPKHRKTPSLK